MVDRNEEVDPTRSLSDLEGCIGWVQQLLVTLVCIEGWPGVGYTSGDTVYQDA